VVRSVKVSLAGWLACVLALVVLTYLAFGVEGVRRLDAELLAALAASPGSSANAWAEAFARLADPLPLLVMLAAVCALGVHLGRLPNGFVKRPSRFSPRRECGCAASRGGRQRGDEPKR
jgi:hypothetical protein